MAKKWFVFDDADGSYEELQGPNPEQQTAEILWGVDQDDYAAGLFHRAVFDHDGDAYEDLVDYMWDEYGIDFEEAFSWEDFRQAYENGLA